MNNLTKQIETTDWKLDPIEDEYFLKKIYSSTLLEDTMSVLKFLTNEPTINRIVEFGSGLSTAMFTRELARKVNGSTELVSIDDSDHYLKITEDTVKQMTPQAKVSYIHAPIRKISVNGKQFQSYSNKSVQKKLSGKYDLVLIDGPMGWKYGREVPLYEVLDFITPQTIILLDDARRDSEKKDMAGWQNTFGDDIEITYLDKFQKGLTIVKFKEINYKIKYSLLNKNSFQIKHL